MDQIALHHALSACTFTYGSIYIVYKHISFSDRSGFHFSLAFSRMYSLTDSFGIRQTRPLR